MKKKIQIIQIHKSKLFPLEGNPRQIVDENAVAKLRKLIKGHGFRGVLEVLKNRKGKWEIIIGNHRFDAGVLEGITEFPCQEFKGTRKQALARALSDNKSSEWTDWDYPKLKDIITEIDDGKTDMEMTGFEKEEIDEMFDRSGGGGGEGDEGEGDICSECGRKL